VVSQIKTQCGVAGHRTGPWARRSARATRGTAIGTLGLPLSEPGSRPFQPIVRRIAPFALRLYRRLDSREI
jgi:hypothetical protein